MLRFIVRREKLTELDDGWAVYDTQEDFVVQWYPLSRLRAAIVESALWNADSEPAFTAGAGRSA